MLQDDRPIFLHSISFNLAWQRLAVKKKKKELGASWVDLLVLKDQELLEVSFKVKFLQFSVAFFYPTLFC